MLDLAQKAASDGCVLQYVASRARGPLEVGLKPVPASSPLGKLRGTANMLELHTEYFEDAPLVVQVMVLTSTFRVSPHCYLCFERCPGRFPSLGVPSRRAYTCPGRDAGPGGVPLRAGCWRTLLSWPTLLHRSDLGQNRIPLTSKLDYHPSTH